MKFDSNRAWQDAISAVSANRQVLVPVAGVFFLLPALLSSVFLADAQTEIMANFGKAEVVERVVGDNLGLFLGFGIGGALIQGLGYLAVMALVGGRGRPTVGQAILGALRALPTLAGAFLLSLAGMFMVTAALAGLFASIVGIVAGVGVASAVAAVGAMAVMVYVSIKLSLVVPLVIAEGIGNPVAAMVRSWQLTRRNSMRLCGFFALLMIGYVAISFAAALALIGPVALLAGEGKVLTLFSGVVSSTIGAGASVVLVSVLAHIHRQLAGLSPAAMSRTFD